jgi:predicted phage baseplate assembly protein
LLVPAVGKTPWTIDRPFLVNASDPITTALPRTTVGGDFVVAIMGSSLAWGAVSSIVRDEQAPQASIAPVSPWQRTSGDLLLAATTVFGHFTKQLRLTDWKSNPTPISGSDIPLDLPAQTASLTVGRKLVVYRPDAPDRGYLTAVSAVSDTLRLRDGIPAGAGFTRENLRIAGNVVLASHGERQPEKVLGSGDATLSGQRFVLAQQMVSFVPDPTQPRGVRADVDVVVDGRIWQQVGALRDFGPADPVYTVKIAEDGTLDLEFGDGQTGRRLPTGRNNVRVRARAGVGLAGNLPAGTLTKIAKPHPLVSAVQQPLPTVGGNDRETADSLRKTAPTTLLTLQRCVSPADFASLAAAHASIWQARAFVRQSTGTRAHRVEVIVVPADGAELGELAQTLATFLQSHALPNVEVTVTRFRPLPVTLAVTVEIDLAAFDPAVVLRDVRAALYDALSLRRRELGQPVFLGDVYAVVENVPGVSTSRCVLNDDPTANRILSVSDGVLFLDPASPQSLSLAYEAKP